MWALPWNFILIADCDFCFFYRNVYVTNDQVLLNEYASTRKGQYEGTENDAKRTQTSYEEYLICSYVHVYIHAQVLK